MSSPESFSPPRRVIWMTSDHMRHDHVAAHGHPAMRTPALDRLVQGGTRFRDCYVQNPVCMPSRCSFMTGLYPTQTGVTENGQCLPADFEPTVARTFSAAGYRTAQIGKLHFQPHEDLDFDPRPRHTYGFDVFWPSEERGNYSDPYYHWLEGRYPEYAAAFRVPRSSDPRRHATEKAPRPVDAPWQASHAGWIVDAAQRYLATRAGSRQFLHLGFYNPHPPLTPVREAWAPYAEAPFPPPCRREAEWEGKPEPLASMLRSRRDWSASDFLAYRRGLAAMVTEMDLAIGALIQWLEAQGMLADTLLVFSSDHGDFAGDHGLTHKSAAYYDGVMRVPVILHWPAGLGQAPRECTGLAEKLDLLPTLLGLSGAEPPAAMMGRDLSADLLAGRDPAGREDVFAYHGKGAAMLRTPRYKYLRYQSTGGEVLYDLDDPEPEMANRAAEPAYRPVLAELRERMLGRLLEAGTSPRPRIHPY